MEERLKNCPFCGGEASLTQDNNPPNNHWWVACYNNSCPAMPQATNVEYPKDNTREEAIKSWNTRSAPVSSQILEHLAKEMYETCHYPEPDSFESQDESTKYRWRINAKLIADKFFPSMVKTDPVSSGWEKEFDKRFMADGELLIPEGKDDAKDIKDFIRQLLAGRGK